ncbi:unnamed protein product, partial [Polarella glacialis]
LGWASRSAASTPSLIVSDILDAACSSSASDLQDFANHRFATPSRGRSPDSVGSTYRRRVSPCVIGMSPASGSQRRVQRQSGASRQSQSVPRLPFHEHISGGPRSCAPRTPSSAYDSGTRNSSCRRSEGSDSRREDSSQEDRLQSTPSARLEPQHISGGPRGCAPRTPSSAYDSGTRNSSCRRSEGSDSRREDSSQEDRLQSTPSARLEPQREEPSLSQLLPPSAASGSGTKRSAEAPLSCQAALELGVFFDAERRLGPLQWPPWPLPACQAEAPVPQPGTAQSPPASRAAAAEQRPKSAPMLRNPAASVSSSALPGTPADE